MNMAIMSFCGIGKRVVSNAYDSRPMIVFSGFNRKREEKLLESSWLLENLNGLVSTTSSEDRITTK